MNIVYAVKIFASLVACAVVMRLFVGRALQEIMEPQDLRQGWLGIVGTLFIACFCVFPPIFFVLLPIWALFLSHSFGKERRGRLQAYVLLTCISPAMGLELENIGPIKDVLALTPGRILGLFLLLPEALRLMQQRVSSPKPSWLSLADAATFGFFAYWIWHLYGGAPASTVLRQAVQLALDTILPYYVLSRVCVSGDIRRRILAIVLFGATYETFVGMAESASGHYLYSQLQYLYGVSWMQSTGLFRGSWLRAEAAFSGPLPLAVLLMFAIGLWFVLRPEVKSRAYLLLGVCMGAGLLATYGRGPLMATALLVIGVGLLRIWTPKMYLIATAVALTVIAGAWSAGLGDLVVAAIAHTTGADETANFNVLYRQELLSTSLALLKQSPWWGVPNYLPAMESLRQGDGIIDLVNTYLVVALNVGLVGLMAYLLPFAIVLWKGASRETAVNDPTLREGRMWLPLTVAVMVAVFTVSPVSIVQPILVWTVAFGLARLREGVRTDGLRAREQAQAEIRPQPFKARSALV